MRQHFNHGIENAVLIWRWDDLTFAIQCSHPHTTKAALQLGRSSFACYPDMLCCVDIVTGSNACPGGEVVNELPCEFCRGVRVACLNGANQAALNAGTGRGEVVCG